MRKCISILLIIALALSCLILSGCDDDYSAQDLQDAKGRYFTGKASKSDKIMVEGFYKWKANQ
ncbi:MAG: hypothetical protein IJN84_05025 [Clostridia bacterium]|nr:hypothetical protein [Clostridia bacterium]